jgi:ribonuclease E
VAHLPIEVATFLVNEKRSQVSAIESRQEVQIIVVPDPNLETPNYELTRIRQQDLPAGVAPASFRLVPTSARAEIQVGVRDRRPPEEPVVKAIAQEPPSPPPEPVSPLGPAPQTGFIRRFLSTLFKEERPNDSRQPQGSEPPPPATPPPAEVERVPAVAPTANSVGHRRGGRPPRGGRRSRTPVAPGSQAAEAVPDAVSAPEAPNAAGSESNLPSSPEAATSGAGNEYNPEGNVSKRSRGRGRSGRRGGHSGRRGRRGGSGTRTETEAGPDHDRPIPAEVTGVEDTPPAIDPPARAGMDSDPDRPPRAPEPEARVARESVVEGTGLDGGEARIASDIAGGAPAPAPLGGSSNRPEGPQSAREPVPYAGEPASDEHRHSE